MKMASLAVAAIVLCGAAVMVGRARAAEIRVLATPGVREIYNELVPQFERASGHKVTSEWAGTVDVTKRIGGGETVDLVIMARNSLDELTRQGRIVAASRVNVAKSGMGVAVRAGAQKPDIASGDAVKALMLSAQSIAYSSGPSGVYLERLVQRMGIADAIKAKMKQIPPGGAVGEWVARGDAEIGFHQVSELIPVKGIDIVGPLPPDIQEMTVFAAGVHANASQADAAAALAAWLAAPEAAAVIRKHGLEPG
jgi:molybdate transport system substrate-binding protein